MTRSEFEELVGRLERVAKQDPEGYRRRVIALALAGYAYLGLVLAFLVGLLGLALVSIVWLKAFGVKLAIGVGAFIYFVVRALWVKFSPPSGLRVTAKEAPGLFAMVEALQEKLKAPPFHEIHIDDRFNASVAQAARLGIFGWYRNYLTIGLPLMKALTPQQLEAVIAHEIGHLAGGHGRMSNWVYRLRIAWERLLGELQANRSFGSFLFTPFFSRYEPYFHAYSFPLARTNEYQADAASARLTNVRTLASALTNIEVVGAYLDQRFWPAIDRRASETRAPNFGPCGLLGANLAAGLPADDQRAWLQAAISRATTLHDTHPSLSDRLAAVGQVPSFEPPAPGAASDQLLQPTLDAIQSQLDEGWKAAVTPQWQQRHDDHAAARERFAALAQRRAEGTALEAGDMVELARLTEYVGEGTEVALPLFREAVALGPDNPLVHYELGWRLLRRDDAEGLPLMERALALQPDAQGVISEHMRDYLWRAGRKEEAEAWHQRVLQATRASDQAAYERGHITSKDKMLRHGLDAETIARLRADLIALGVHKAWLVRKQLAGDARETVYVLGFKATPMWKWLSEKNRVELQQKIAQAIQLPGECMVFSLEGSGAHFQSKFRWKKARVL